MKTLWQRAAMGLLALALTLGTVDSQATTVLLLTRQQLVQQSDLVVRATPGQPESRWNKERTLITTSTRLQVRSFLKGSGPKELVLEQLGGKVGEDALVLPGDAQLTPGEDVVLFLRNGEQGAVNLTALAQAAYHVHGDKVQRDLSGLQVMRKVGGKLRPMPHKPEPREPLAKLMADVVRIVRGR
jgi:hypothetical protein